MQIPNPKCCMIIIFTNPSISPNESQIKSNSNANPKSQMLHDHNLYKAKDAAPNESQIKSNSIANPKCCLIIISTNPRMPLQTNPKSNQIKMQIPNSICCMILISTNPRMPNPKDDLYNPKDAAPNGLDEAAHRRHNNFSALPKQVSLISIIIGHHGSSNFAFVVKSNVVR